ncbi:MAG: carbohydrate ABC transporter permease, partial [Methylomonas sp.]|nr:carbohydrate ABC transporter permease [Methylomonas sp.]
MMLFPFLFMFFTSLKQSQDTFNFPPRLLPRNQTYISVPGFEEPLKLYLLEDANGIMREFALSRDIVQVGVFRDPTVPRDPNNPNAGEMIDNRPLKDVQPSQNRIIYEGQWEDLYETPVDGQIVPMVLVREAGANVFFNPENPQETVLAIARTSKRVEYISFHPENYLEVLQLAEGSKAVLTNVLSMARSLTNTTLVTLLVVLGQLITSVLGGYAFARLRFPGRDNLFVIYLGTIMIPFVVLIIPLYRLMVIVEWVDRLAALIIPWIFTAYGTFLMRQFFITVPKDIEDAAIIDGANRFQILWRIFIPAAAPALATQATFTFLYAWNSFFWPLVIINT